MNIQWKGNGDEGCLPEGLKIFVGKFVDDEIEIT